jgi:CheY-like chemotaxis protein
VAAVRALVIEDNDDMRYLVRVVLELADPPVEVVAEARSGQDALEVWRATQPDLVILDYRLPGLNGIEIAEQILGEDAEQPIILFSAFVDEPVVRRAARVGVRACVSKDEIRRLPELAVEHARK